MQISIRSLQNRIPKVYGNPLQVSFSTKKPFFQLIYNLSISFLWEIFVSVLRVLSFARVRMQEHWIHR